ncbi:MAG: extensin family protein [Acidobacteriota bacterium]
MRLAAVLVVALSGIAIARPAHKTRRRHSSEPIDRSRFSAPADADQQPAVRYAALAQDACEAELTSRKIGFTREPAPGVRGGVRVTTPLHGVVFRTNDKDHGSSRYEITDCRLVLALDDFAKILATHDIVEVRHYSIYRAPPKSWPEGKLGSRHNGALAIDAARFVKSDGSFLDVLQHFHGAIGAKTCGEGAGPHPVTPEATEIREILCDAVAQHLFNVVLTPNYNRPHRNHFHLEITEGAHWFLVH